MSALTWPFADSGPSWGVGCLRGRGVVGGGGRGSRRRRVGGTLGGPRHRGEHFQSSGSHQSELVAAVVATATAHAHDRVRVLSHSLKKTSNQ